MNTDYFLGTPAFIEGNPNLREPQVLAYMAIKEHFSSERKSEPAVVCLPTGTGKTGLMAIAPFGVSSGRILIIAPGTVIRDELLRKLDSNGLANFWLQQKVIPRRSLPVLVEYQPNHDAEFLRQAHIVITNIHRLQRSNTNNLLSKVPRDFFDMILIDEAHHSPAQSWVEVQSHFSSAKVVKVTGTPFRTDGLEISGRRVYSYRLGRAMQLGYVKKMARLTHITDDLTFEVPQEDGSLKRMPLDHALEMTDAEWISRQVAYSKSCSELIVRESLAVLNMKRHETNNPHKLIAVAMSVRHAEQVRDLYEQAGAKATVIHSHQESGENDINLTDFENDRCQVIVHVQKLGEGYDHPYISVAAIFRPFRSILAYAQFAGRTLRVIDGGSVIDNTAHLIHHEALNLEELWQFYRDEERLAEVLGHLSAIRTDNDDYEDDDAGVDDSASGRRVIPTYDVLEHGSLVSKAESYITGEDFQRDFELAVAENRRRAEEGIALLKKAGQQVSPEFEEQLRELFESKATEDLLTSKRPDLVLAERRRHLTGFVQEGVASLLAELGIDPKAPPEEHVVGQLWSSYRRLASKTLDGWLVAVVNTQLKDFIGYTRDRWKVDDYKRAQPQAETYLRNLSAYLRVKG